LGDLDSGLTGEDCWCLPYRVFGLVCVIYLVHCCLSYRLFGLVLLYIWFTVDWEFWTVDLLGKTVVVYHIDYLAWCCYIFGSLWIESFGQWTYWGDEYLGYSATYAPCVPLSPPCVSMVYFHDSHCIYTRQEMSNLLVNEWCAFFLDWMQKMNFFFIQG
jgi:hypothetical protein